MVATAVETGAIRNPVRRLYNWVLSWADSPYALWALFVISFAEASFFEFADLRLLAAGYQSAAMETLQVVSY